jgi:hypothetical protein
MLIKHPQGFKTALQSHRIAGMSPAQKQFSLNRAGLNKQFPISLVSVAPKSTQGKDY